MRAMTDSQTAFSDSAAYHEAGHMTAAVVQAMPIQPRGMHVDVDRRGIAHYWMRTPGDKANLLIDQIERKRSIVTLYAGWISERTFCPIVLTTVGSATGAR